MGDKSKLYTRNFHNMFEISSMVQKTLRRNMLFEASYAAYEMSEKYRSYLWKRILTMSAEDCYYNVTSYVMSLYRRDVATSPDDYTYIECAIGFLCATDKCRDADYFACNLMNSKYKINLASIEPTLTDAGSKQYPTKNGHSMFDVSGALCHFIEIKDYYMAGYCVNELYWRYSTYTWITMVNECKKLGVPDMLLKEIEALSEADKKFSADNSTTIFISKAVVLLIRWLEIGDETLSDKISYQKPEFSKMNLSRRISIPRFVFDCHTYQGKVSGMTKEMFVRDEQAALTPLHKGKFDVASWERFFTLCREGFIDKEHTAPWPEESTRKAIQQGQLELNLFG